VADLAVCIADGGRVLSDLAVLRDQAELYGPVASDPTVWRTLDAVGEPERAGIAAARAKVRRRVWTLIAQRHGRIPPSRVADVDLGKTVVIRMDATIAIAHSAKQRAAGTFKGSYGHHPLAAWCDNTGEALALMGRPGNAGSNTAADHLAVLGEAIRQIPTRSGATCWSPSTAPAPPSTWSTTSPRSTPCTGVGCTTRWGSTWTTAPGPPSGSSARTTGSTCGTATASRGGSTAHTAPGWSS
jgi:hypothetical protein